MIIIIALPIIAFFAWEVVFTVTYYTERLHPDRFILPNTYQAWIVIEYNNAACPPLEKNEDFRIFPVTWDGYLCTKDNPLKGWSTDVYHYQDQPDVNLINNPRSGRNRIWHEDHLDYQGRPLYVFYVGLEREHKKLQALIEKFVISKSKTF